MAEMIITSKRCMFCGKEHLIEMPREAFDRWRGGEHIQDVFPAMSADEREILISGTCPECWDLHMGGDDE